MVVAFWKMWCDFMSVVLFFPLAVFHSLQLLNADAKVKMMLLPAKSLSQR